jgi:hypothetical protein
MVSVLALSVVDSGFEPGRVKPKTISISSSRHIAPVTGQYAGKH